jgi:hypothetical protein
MRHGQICAPGWQQSWKPEPETRTMARRPLRAYAAAAPDEAEIVALSPGVGILGYSQASVRVTSHAAYYETLTAVMLGHAICDLA